MGRAGRLAEDGSAPCCKWSGSDFPSSMIDAVRFRVVESYGRREEPVKRHGVLQPATRVTTAAQSGDDYARKGCLFAKASTFRSIVSSAIFCASRMSPGARPPSGAKHHCATLRPAGLS
jgi:hypothetical protein